MHVESLEHFALEIPGSVVSAEVVDGVSSSIELVRLERGRRVILHHVKLSGACSVELEMTTSPVPPKTSGSGRISPG